MGNPMWILQSKLKALSKRLSQWSRKDIVDINEVVINWDEKLQYLEDKDIEDNTEQSREKVNKAHDKYIRCLSIQDSLLKQKYRIKWFEDGNSNTRYFHCILREKIRKQQVNRIKNHKGKWIMGDEKISKAAVMHFNSQFNLPTPNLNPTILECIPNCITKEDNLCLSKILDEAEIKNVVLSLSASSTAGPDGYNGAFLHNC
uniref:RNA-directed DNA polymerase from mobile element jockey-like n=1 Tax=Nicotiana tabacum TaxID=4097 RepID=A0A1S3Z310_TOBAC|nr:PREDICTED: uncharacterized protein LOC107782383 [Nicotiana tabacum]